LPVFDYKLVNTKFIPQAHENRFLFIKYGELSNYFSGISNYAHLNRNFSEMPLFVSCEFLSHLSFRLSGYQLLFASHGFFWNLNLVDFIIPIPLFLEKDILYMTHTGKLIKSFTVLNQQKVFSISLILNNISLNTRVLDYKFENWLFNSSLFDSCVGFVSSNIKKYFIPNFSIGSCLNSNFIYGNSAITQAALLLQLCENIFFKGSNYR